jgi:hypothetical protein
LLILWECIVTSNCGTKLDAYGFWMALLELRELSRTMICHHTVEDVDFFKVVKLCDGFRATVIDHAAAD